MKKLRIKLFSFIQNHPGSTIASIKIARMISKETKVSITCDGSIGNEPLDALVIINGAYAFCDVLPQLGTAILEARRVIWVQNDYTIIPPKPDAKAKSPFRAAFVRRRDEGKTDTAYWTTCEDWAKLRGSAYVNWNCLSFEKRHDSRRKEKVADLFYYGSYRAGSGRSSREMYFDRYFRTPAVPTTISSPAKQFAERYDKVEHVPKVQGDLLAEIARHGAGLYLEDRMSHEHYHSPPNRFYEMLSVGLPMIFQPECGSALRRGGYDTTDYQAAHGIGLKRLFERRAEIGAEQYERWYDKAAKEREELPLRLQQIWGSLQRELAS